MRRKGQVCDRIPLFAFDADLYSPTQVGPRYWLPLVVPGQVVLFDEYWMPPWEGKSKAVDEFFSQYSVHIRRPDWCSNSVGSNAIRTCV